MSKREKRRQENKSSESSSGSFWTRPSFWWVSIIGALIGLMPFIYTTFFAAKGANVSSPTNNSYIYSIRVEDETSGKIIERAQVIIEIGGATYLTSISDSLGIAIITIPVSKTDQSALLRVQASGYQTHSRNIVLGRDKLPEIVQLKKEIGINPTSPLVSTSTRIATAVPTLTLSPSKGAYKPNGNCDEVPPPCTYTVRGGDGNILIAEKFYSNRIFTWLLLEYNRADDGNYQESLVPRMSIFIPEKDSPPKLAFPLCAQPANPPCQYKALGNDTYEIIAQDFYKNTSMADMIRNANKEYDPLSDTLLHKKIREGTTLIMPKIP